MILAEKNASRPEAAQSAVPTAAIIRSHAHRGNSSTVSTKLARALATREIEMLETTRNNDNKNKILAIEDDPEVLALYKSYLQKRGYVVLSASGAVEGMSLLSDHPDTRLILLDLNLPGMSGEEWIAWYVQQGKQTPVVVASGKGDILTITKGNNMTAALTKPFHMEELQELIEVLLADDWHDQVSVDKKLH
jgi:CheY-like chemotaxis protein